MSEGACGTATGGAVVDGVLFDIDDTLVDTVGAFGAALSQIAERYLPNIETARHGELVAVWRADVGGYYRRYARGEMGYLEQRMTRANALHDQFGGVELDADTYREWNEVFERGFADAWSAHPDVRGAVDRLAADGLAIGALTNAAVAYQTRKMDQVGLRDRVPVLVGVDTLGVGKPDPRVFAEACRRLGTAPERTAYVGDELDIDARAAAAAGLVGVWVDRPGPRRVEIPDGDVAAARDGRILVIRSLAELPRVLGLSV